MALNQVPLKTISNVNKTSCSLYCTVHRDCYYFNLQRNTGTCELLEFITDPSLLETKTGWDFIHTNLYAKAVRNLKFIYSIFYKIETIWVWRSVSVFLIFWMTNPFLANVPIYTTWKNQKLIFFRCFQSAFNGNIFQKWVKAIFSK